MKHRGWMAIYEKAPEIRLWWRDVDMSERCMYMELRLYGREGDALLEGVSNFKYMGPTLDQTDNV